MKKRGILILLAGLLTFGLSGCSKELSDDNITIKQYEGLEVTKVEETEVTDDMVDNAVNNYLSQDTSVEREAEDGDTVKIDYVGTIDGTEFDGGTANGATLVLGEGQYIGAEGDYKGFEEQIVGHKPGENFDITVKFADDYQGTEVAGKVADFNITLTQIYPELTDEWVKKNSEESETVEEYKKEIRGMLEENYEAVAHSSLQSEVLEALLEQVEVKKLPEEDVEEQFNKFDETYRNMAESYGVEFSEFTQTYLGMTEEQFKEQAQTESENMVKRELACNLIAEKKKLIPTDKEYEEKIAEYAERSNFDDVEQFKEQYGEDFIKTAILQEKVVDYLVDKCVQVEETGTTETK